jgi:hypothetical protein
MHVGMHSQIKPQLWGMMTRQIHRYQHAMLSSAHPDHRHYRCHYHCHYRCHYHHPDTTHPLLASCRTNLRLWRQEEVQDGVGEPLPPSPVTDGFARVMTGLYARLQAAAGAGTSRAAANSSTDNSASFFPAHPHRVAPAGCETISA